MNTEHVEKKINPLKDDVMGALRANDRMIEPEICLPAQFYSPPNELSAEKKLMLAIMEDAVACITRLKSSESYSSSTIAETLKWIRSTDETWLFSFERICDALRWDAGNLRRRLIDLTEQKITFRRKRTGVSGTKRTLCPTYARR